MIRKITIALGENPSGYLLSWRYSGRVWYRHVPAEHTRDDTIASTYRLFTSAEFAQRRRRHSNELMLIIVPNEFLYWVACVDNRSGSVLFWNWVCRSGLAARTGWRFRVPHVFILVPQKKRRAK